MRTSRLYLLIYRNRSSHGFAIDPSWGWGWGGLFPFLPGLFGVLTAGSDVMALDLNPPTLPLRAASLSLHHGGKVCEVISLQR